MSDVPATVRDHDLGTRCGTVLLDDGALVSYSAAAFDAGDLLLLRSGQRVRLHLDADGSVAAVTLPGFSRP